MAKTIKFNTRWKTSKNYRGFKREFFNRGYFRCVQQ